MSEPAEFLERDADPGLALHERTPVRLPLAVWLMCSAAMVSAGVSWGISQQQLTAHERRIEALSIRAAANESRVNDLRVLLERIDERTATMKQQLERIAH